VIGRYGSVIEDARCWTGLSEDDRDELIRFVRQNAELIFYAPFAYSRFDSPGEHPDLPPAGPWWEIGYR
jgi:hypothetical protein